MMERFLHNYACVAIGVLMFDFVGQSLWKFLATLAIVAAVSGLLTWVETISGLWRKEP